MSKLYLRAHPERLIEKELFPEASKEELRVFLAIIAHGSECSEEQIASLAKCSLSRCKSALTLFSEEKIIEISDTPFQNAEIEYEHGSISHFSDIEEDTPKDVAESISRYELSALLDECAAILGKAALSSTEAAKIVSLVTGLALSGEYITTLLSFLKSERKCTVSRLVSKAEELVGRGIDSFDSLNDYIRDRELPGYVFEYRRVLGIYGRAISKSEKECYKKWAEDFCYSTEILALAYDKAVIAGSAKSLSYIDAILSGWHAAGCKTVAECETSHKAFKDARNAEKKEHAEKSTKRSKTAAPTPRYGDFDVEEAFKLALSRSYGDEDKE